jgi:RNase adaptor protein for sRNA GlmZ degradation
MLLDLYSFGFRRSGIPDDSSGHGGGFVFDCRSLPNPGKFEEYRELTGLDASVQDWLGANEETETFLAYLKGILGLSVKKYIERDFECLMVSCGCTGGQHRSVYVAEFLRQHFAANSALMIQVTHTEQPFWPYIPDSGIPSVSKF